MHPVRLLKKTIKHYLPNITQHNNATLHIIKRDVKTLLTTLEEIDFIRQADIESLENVFQTEKDKDQAAHLILTFFTKWYDKGKFLYPEMLRKAGYEIVKRKRLCVPALWNGFATDAYLGSQNAVLAKKIRSS